MDVSKLAKSSLLIFLVEQFEFFFNAFIYVDTGSHIVLRQRHSYTVSPE